MRSPVPSDPPRVLEADDAVVDAATELVPDAGVRDVERAALQVTLNAIYASRVVDRPAWTWGW